MKFQTQTYYNEQISVCCPPLAPLVLVADLPGRRALGTSRLSMPSVRLSTIGSRAFPVAGPRIWNTLPQETTSAQSLSLFRQRMKLHLFRQSYPDLIF